MFVGKGARLEKNRFPSDLTASRCSFFPLKNEQMEKGMKKVGLARTSREVERSVSRTLSLSESETGRSD